MPYASYRRATSVAPAFAPTYPLSHAVQHRKASAHIHGGVNVQTKRHFSTAFAQARLATPSHASHTSQTHSPLMQGRSRRKAAGPSTPTVWPAAFALMLVANLIAPVASVDPVAAFVPKGVRRCHRNDETHGDASGCAPPVLPDQARPMPGDMGDVGDVGDAVRAEPVDPTMTLKDRYSPQDVLRSMGTGRAPFRHLGDSIADMYVLLTGNTVGQHMREEIQQRVDLVDMVTGLIPKVAMSRVPSEVAEAVADGIDGKSITADRIISIVQSTDPRVLAHPRVNTAREKAAQATLDKPGAVAPAVHIESSEKSLKDIEKKVAATDMERIVDEAGRSAPAPDASPGRVSDEMPAVSNPELDLRGAHEALRICGGDCANRRVTTPDSIATSRHEVDSVLGHLRNNGARSAILLAYNDVSRMELLRSNPPNLRHYRDYSIIPNREAVRIALEHVPPDTPLYEQQRLAAVITASHSRMNPGTNALGQENAEILFHFLIENGVHGDCIRMITVHPKGRSPHSLVLYTESEALIDALKLATPVQFEGPGVDGISGNTFAGLIMNAHDTTLLLDPWSRVKAVGFALSKDPQETRRVLDAAFADFGHRPGEAYRVSLTRPLGSRRTGTSRQGSLASRGIAATVWRKSTTGGSPVTSNASSRLASPDAPKLPLANGDESADGA
ncbi:hypothetical protein [Pandoraea oxalativorans]|uniref:Uncharacterized protein n=1 Tax=Pandoraea oxalativorans TaxID=573737 RepID=A0A0E3U5H9_9BURK|nr:hypothetical protein [Pandoraea oxalativorans]AKC69194.1 hypothetical protein MB84_06485 [Pandoraea oxalativorans]